MFLEIKPNEIDKSVFNLYNTSWALVSAGTQEDFNTMTISWGGLGHLWYRDTATIYIRPTRYTYQYIEREEYFTISFFDDKYKKDLGYLGKVSGRDGDKIAQTSLTPEFISDFPTFKEADYVLLCKKVHGMDFSPEQFLNDDILKLYEPDKNYHKQYIGLIEKVWKKA